MKKGIIYIILAFAAAVSCGSEAVEQQPSTFADTITPADSTQYSAVLRGYSRSRKGSVALIGESDRTRALALNIMNYDRFENTKGTYEKDFLNDFSGEIFDIIYDVANSPYEYNPDSLEAFNTIQVKNVILALDTLAYDSEKNLYDYVVKDPAKVVVLSSMYSDVASEIRKINKYYKHNIKVFEQGTVLREYISSRYTENSYIAVWGRKETLEGEFYHDMATSLGLRTYSAMDFETDWKSAKEETDTLLFRYLDTLASRRPHSKVSCVVIDDHTLAQRASALNAKIATLTQSEDPAILKYANLLAKDFRFINPMDVISGELYKYMRQENLFTHRVDTPLFTSFVTLNNGGEYALANFTYGQ